MKKLNTPFIFKSIFDEDGEIDFYLANFADKIANQENIYITSDREIDSVILNENNDVVAAAWTSWDGENYEFDIVVSKDFQGKGIGSYLIDNYAEIPEFYKEINPDATMNIHVVNEKLKNILTNKGFDISTTISKENYIMTKDDDKKINDYLKQKINEENKPTIKRPKNK
jgi:GNAT superfamily N-acetyltransferase